MNGVRIEPLAAEHWADVERIYAAGIATGHATFEVAPPTWEAFDAGKVREHRFVALDDDGRVLGWAAASAVSDRCVYAGVIEHSVYVDPAARGRGVGRALLDALLDSAAGFRVVGTRERLGRMTYGPLAGQWRDVVLMERRLATDV